MNRLDCSIWAEELLMLWPHAIRAGARPAVNAAKVLPPRTVIVTQVGRRAVNAHKVLRPQAVNAAQVLRPQAVNANQVVRLEAVSAKQERQPALIAKPAASQGVANKATTLIEDDKNVRNPVIATPAVRSG